MRDALSDSLVRYGSQLSNMVVLTGDHGYALFDKFRASCGDKFINAGVAEQNMVGVAAGLARAGFKPVVYGLSAFVPMRVIEQMKIDVCHDGLPVIFLGDGAGLVYSTQSTTHQCGEDIAATRVLPNLAVLSPADRHELTAAMDLAIRLAKPVYVRIGKADLGDVHSGPVQMSPGRLLAVAKAVSGITFIATGAMVKTAQNLQKEFGAALWSAPCIKPLDAKQVEGIARESDVIVTLEEHSVYGGLGSAIAEIVSQNSPVRVLRIGLNDRFSEHCGSYKSLCIEHEIDEVSVRRKVSAYLAKALIGGRHAHQAR